MADMTTGGQPPGGRLVPAVSRMRGDMAGVAAGCAAALAVMLPTVDSSRWSGGTAALQVALAAGIAVLFALLARRPRLRASLAARLASAEPVTEPAALWRDSAGRRAGLLREAVLAGLFVLGCGLFAGYAQHLPLLVLALPLAQLAQVPWLRTVGRWERAHHVVLWEPPLGAPRSGSLPRAFFSTPEEVTPAPG